MMITTVVMRNIRSQPFLAVRLRWYFLCEEDIAAAHLPYIFFFILSSSFKSFNPPPYIYTYEHNYIYKSFFGIDHNCTTCAMFSSPTDGFSYPRVRLCVRASVWECECARIYIYIYIKKTSHALLIAFSFGFSLSLKVQLSLRLHPPPRSRLFLFCCLCDYADEHANIRLLLIRIATPSSPRLCCRLISPLYCPSTHTHTRTHQQRPPTPCLTIAPAKTLSITTESTILAFVIIIQSDVSSQ